MDVAYIDAGAVVQGNGSSTTIPLPASLVAGDFLLAMVMTTSGARHDWPGGWRLVSRLSVGELELSLVYRSAMRLTSLVEPVVSWVDDDGEPISADYAGRIFQYRNATGIVQSAGEVGLIDPSTGTALPILVDAMTTTRVDSMALYIGGGSQNFAFDAVAGWTEHLDSGGDVAAHRFVAAGKKIASPGSTGSITIANGPEPWGMWLLELASAFANIEANIALPEFSVTGNFHSPRPTFNEYIPTADDAAFMLMSLLPKGRAFGTNDFSIPREESVLKQFWYVVALQLVDLEYKMVQMLDEAFCSYIYNDLDGWIKDYLLPDEEAIYGSSICSKSNQAGAITLDEYKRVAESLDWWILDIQFLKRTDEDYSGVHSTLYVLVSLESPIIPPPTYLGVDFILGTSILGVWGTVPKLIAVLEGLYDRLVPAHIDILIEAE